MADNSHFLNNAFGRMYQGSDTKTENNQGVQQFSTSTKPDDFTRFVGGHNRNIKPYVSGYWYFVLSPPKAIFTDSSTTSAGTQNEFSHLEVMQWMHTSAESFTPPSVTISKQDVPGMGGLGSSFMVGKEITRTFTVAFREYQNLPITSIVKKWHSFLDMHLAVSWARGNEFIPANYKGWAAALLCRPTVSEQNRFLINKDDIEQAYIFDGVWPESSADDSFNSDISSNELAQISLTWSFDGAFMTKFTDNGEILDAVLNFLGSVSKGVASSKNSFDIFKESILNSEVQSA